MPRTYYQAYLRPQGVQGLLARLLLVLTLIAVVVLAAFFFAFALAIVAVLGSVVALRLWWIGRRLRKSGVQTLDGHYVVISRERSDRF